MKTLPSTIRQHVTNENGAFEENRKFSILYLYYIDWTFKLNFRTILKYFRLVIIDSKIKGINRAWFLISALDLRRLSKEEPQVFSSKFFFFFSPFSFMGVSQVLRVKRGKNNKNPDSMPWTLSNNNSLPNSLSPQNWFEDISNPERFLLWSAILFFWLLSVMEKTVPF